MPRDQAGPCRTARRRWHRALWAGLLAPLILGAEPPAPKPDGLFITVAGPVTRGGRHRIQSQVDAAVSRGVGTIVFDIRPARNEFGPCRELATFISRIRGAKTVAFVSQPIRTHTVLLALGCNDIVMAPKATIGNAGADEDHIGVTLRSGYTELANAQGYPVALALAMLDKDLEVLEAEAARSGKQYILRQDLAALKAKEKLLRQPRVVVPATDPAVFSAEVAQQLGLCRDVLSDRQAVARAYKLDPRAALEDVLGAETPRAVVIKIDGLIDQEQAEFVRRRMRQAISQLEANLIIFVVNSPGGALGPSEDLADDVLDVSASGTVKTVAYVPRKAMSGAAWFCLACNEIVMRESASLGDVGVIFMDPEGRLRYAEEKIVSHVRKRLRAMADKNGYPPALAEAMTGKDDVVLRIQHRATGQVRYVRDTQYDAMPDRAQWVQAGVVKQKGNFWTMTGKEAVTYGFCHQLVESLPEVLTPYGLSPLQVTVIGRSWVDDLIRILNSEFVTGLLFVAGLMGLYLELQMPGFGVPGVLAILSFSLFFWSKYSAGSASALEIVLFLVGLLLLVLEIFVIPGFGVTGVAGILCMLASIVLAMNTFIWPTTDREVIQFSGAMLTLTISLVAFVGLAVAAARFLPTVPVFSRVVLPPPSRDEVASPHMPERSRAAVGEQGVVSTTLRPAGKARFGNRYVDVVAQGEFLDAGTEVQVVRVQGNRIVVKRT